MMSLRTLVIVAALALAGCSGGNGGYYGGSVGYGYDWDNNHHHHDEGTGPDRSPGGQPGMVSKPGSVPERGSNSRRGNSCVFNCDSK